MKTNWAGNVIFGAARYHRPTSVPELQSLVARSERARAVGTGHSFNRLADTDGDQISLVDMPRIVEIDSGSVTVSSALRYGDVAEHLHRAGFALPNLGSLPHISIGGATATATHGSGNGNGNLATSVSALELVTASGELVQLDRQAAVHLGALGIVTRLTLDLVPAFEVAQRVYEDLPYEAMGEALASAYSVSLFTDWRDRRFNQVWRKEIAGQEQEWDLARPADRPRHPIASMSAKNCTEQLGVPGPWYQRLPHFRLEHTPSAGEELQSEFFVPADKAAEALAAIDSVRDRVARVLQISEIRSVAADDLWLSPCYQQSSVAFHFTWIKDPREVEPVIALIEEQLAPLGAKPHWGKLFHARGRYERHEDFEELMRRYDPDGKFRNGITFPSPQSP